MKNKLINYLLAETLGGVDVILVVVVRGLGGGFLNCQEVDMGSVTLVEDDLTVDLGNDDVPGVLGATGGHQAGQDVIGDDNIASVVFQNTAEDGIVGGGDVVEVEIFETLESGGVLGGDFLFHDLVVAVEGTGPEHIGDLDLLGVDRKPREGGERDILLDVPIGKGVDGPKTRFLEFREKKKLNFERMFDENHEF